MQSIELESNAESLQGELLVRATTIHDLPLNSELFCAESLPGTGHGWYVLGPNMVVNGGRQAITNLLGSRDLAVPNPWAVSKVSFGIYDEAPTFGDVTLSPQPSGVYAGGENQILFNGTDAYKDITGSRFPAPYVVEFDLDLAPLEANGYTIREMGLWSTNGTLIARKTFPAIVKSPSFGLSFIWRIRS